ncbi:MULTISPECIES: hypothetical protein [Vibrio]|uniref:hypothetical protein n=2 Tax=Vibrionales TaxID=135623 RepID=UPI002963DC12|nr:hypothetical protein [Vibrio sp. 1731]MCR9687261.1 hypothetical protein [Vibrio antiquarius]MDW2116349.1 hypothetical protein [Vibrio sp. 1731]
MMKSNSEAQRRLALKDKLSAICTVSVMQDDEKTNSIGVSFEYLGVLYTTYLDADTECGELLKHNPNDITVIENIGTTNANDLIEFFDGLPNIEGILK